MNHLIQKNPGPVFHIQGIRICAQDIADYFYISCNARSQRGGIEPDIQHIFGSRIWIRCLEKCQKYIFRHASKSKSGVSYAPARPRPVLLEVSYAPARPRPVLLGVS